MNDDMRPETRDSGDVPTPSAEASAGTSPGAVTVWLTYAQLAESRGITVRSGAAIGAATQMVATAGDRGRKAKDRAEQAAGR